MLNFANPVAVLFFVLISFVTFLLQNKTVFLPLPRYASLLPFADG